MAMQSMKRGLKYSKNFKNLSNFDAEYQLMSPGPETVTMLNGLYQSSNVNLYKHRDYDPKLSSYVKLVE
jgi:hypothetical protein